MHCTYFTFHNLANILSELSQLLPLSYFGKYENNGVICQEILNYFFKNIYSFSLHINIFLEIIICQYIPIFQH